MIVSVYLMYIRLLVVSC